jgi:Ca2+-binding RTX toxin-like protein
LTKEVSIMSDSIQPLETRRLLAATLSTTGVLDITGTSGNDTLSVALSGTNVVVKLNTAAPQNFAASKVKAIHANAGIGNDRVTIGISLPGAVIHGADGNDTITGGSGNDTLYGDNGNDSLLGGNGNDTMDGGAGNDTLSGQGGFDTADYRSAASAIRLTLDKLANDGRVAIGEKDNVLDAEQLLGGIYNDTITGDAGFNQIYGGAGNDEIHAGGGNDDVHGGPGSDKLYGGDGNDTIKGDDGNDLLGGENGNDSLDGGLGADGIFGNAGNDTADYFARTADLRITQDGVANDGQLNETDNVATDVEVVRGGGGNDLIAAHAEYWSEPGAVNNIFYGGAGNDTLRGYAGNDTLVGQDGNDSLEAASGNDSLDGGNGNDTLDGGSFGDLPSFDYVDPAIPDEAADLNTILGGAGDDLVLNSSGDDLISGGSGSDTIDYSANFHNSGVDVTLDGVRNDGEFPYLIEDEYYGGQNFWQIENDNVGVDMENIIGTRFADRLVGNAAANHLVGDYGDDTLIGGDGNDIIDATYLRYVAGDSDNDYVDAGNGDDIIYSRGAWYDTIVGGAGYDRAQVDADDTLSGIEELLP